MKRERERQRQREREREREKSSLVVKMGLKKFFCQNDQKSRVAEVVLLKTNTK